MFILQNLVEHITKNVKIIIHIQNSQYITYNISNIMRQNLKNCFIRFPKMKINFLKIIILIKLSI